jgi:hypothetical protein
MASVETGAAAAATRETTAILYLGDGRQMREAPTLRPTRRVVRDRPLAAQGAPKSWASSYP